jgi:hypothetical protein
MAIVGLTGLGAAGGGAAIAALYGVRGGHTAGAAPAAYVVDVLFRPGSGQTPETNVAQAGPQSASGTAEQGPHAEAERIVQATALRGGSFVPDDRARLADLVAVQAGITRDAAAGRIDRMQAQLREKARATLDVAKRTAAYAALWMALSLIFGAIVAIFSAISARLEDDIATWTKSAGIAPGAFTFRSRRT